MMPVLIVLIIIIAIRGITLPGAAAGLDYLFKPDFQQNTKRKGMGLPHTARYSSVCQLLLQS